MQTWYLEKGALGSAPPDLAIYELSLLLHCAPKAIRDWPMRDLQMLKIVHAAQQATEEELLRRARTEPHS